MELTRDVLADDGLRKMIRAADPDYPLLSDEALNASHQAFLAEAESLPELWVFAYGSLIWNPVIEIAEAVPTRLNGYERSFCLWAYIGRGSYESPGLFLGLDKGAHCDGIAMRIENHHREEETLLLWRREMISGAYIPALLPMTINGAERKVLVFLINPQSTRYAAGLSEEDQRGYLASGEGTLGTARDYLFNLQDKMREHGLNDPYMDRLEKALRQTPT